MDDLTYVLLLLRAFICAAMGNTYIMWTITGSCCAHAYGVQWTTSVPTSALLSFALVHVIKPTKNYAYREEYNHIARRPCVLHILQHGNNDEGEIFDDDNVGRFDDGNGGRFPYVMDRSDSWQTVW
jgi:hypothetical protein